MINSGLLPEDNLQKFYNHHHMLEDLFWVITKDPRKKKIRTTLGDKNLNKEFDFLVYSNRWKHCDTYIVKRTLDGWDVDFLAKSKKGDKYGSAIIDCLEHDSITYPYDVKTYFAAIWEKADNESMSVEKVKTQMNKISKWITKTELQKQVLKLDRLL